MADLSKENLRKEIDVILEGADLDTLSSKKVRQQLEERLKFDLSDRKKEIDEMVMEAVEKRPQAENKDLKPAVKMDDIKDNEVKEPLLKNNKTISSDKSGGDDDDENSETEEEEDDEEDEYKPEDDEESPKKKSSRQQERRQPVRKGSTVIGKAKTKPNVVAENRKSKKAVPKSSDSDENSEESQESEEESEETSTPKKKVAPRNRKPQAKPNPVDYDSENESEPDTKHTKKRRQDSGSEYEEFDENSDSSEEGSDEDYSPGKKSSTKKRGRNATRGNMRRKRADSSDADSDEDWKAASKKKRTTPVKKGEGSASTKSKGSKAVKLSPELADIVGSDSMPRPEVLKKIWSIIKERNLYDPKNKQFAICDDQFLKVFGVKRFKTFGMMKYLKAHFID